MNKQNIIIISVLILLGAVFFLLINSSKTIGTFGTSGKVENPPIITSEKTVTNFEECANAGYPVMESSPRQCLDKNGNHFTENIGNGDLKKDKIVLTNPIPNSKITSPLKITGQARGSWYFEASFPVMLTDWDGKIIAQGVAKAQGDWMTQNFVPFIATLNFTVDPKIYSKKGTLILKKDNPSGLPQNDDALEIPISF